MSLHLTIAFKMKASLACIALVVYHGLYAQPTLSPIGVRSECNYLESIETGVENPLRINHRIVREELGQNSYSLTVAGMFNCAAKNLYGAFKFDGDTLNIFTGVWGENLPPGYRPEKHFAGLRETSFAPAFCDCYFEFSYSFRGVNNKPAHVKHVTGLITALEARSNSRLIERTDRVFEPITNARYTLIADTTFVSWDFDSLNFVDEFGLKQGLWKEQNGVFKTKYVFFADGISIENWALNKIPGKTIDLHQWAGQNYISRVLEYHLNFKVKSDCVRLLELKESTGHAGDYNVIEVCRVYEESGAIKETKQSTLVKH